MGESPKLALLPDSNAKRLVLAFDSEAFEVSLVEMAGRQVLILDCASPEGSTELGLALLRWLSKTSWNKLSGFESEEK